MVGHSIEQTRLVAPFPHAAEGDATPDDSTLSPADWLRRGTVAVVLAATVGFAATLGAAMAFDEDPGGCPASTGDTNCCRLQAQDEFAAGLCVTDGR